jgi:hypothetical protein
MRSRAASWTAIVHDVSTDLLTEPAGEQLPQGDVAAQMAPARKVENHPDLGLTLARTERMLAVHLKTKSLRILALPGQLKRTDKLRRIARE